VGFAPRVSVRLAGGWYHVLSRVTRDHALAVADAG
jgi:hypothetical protein